MKLYNFWRSGTSHRTRIALNLKGISTEYLAVHLGKNAHLAEPALPMPAYLFVETAHLFHRLLHMLKVGRVFEWSVALVDQLELSC